MRWTEEEYKDFKHRQGQPGRFVSGLQASADRTVLAVPAADVLKPRMNKTETRFAQLLELWKRAGDILDYKFEAVTLRLAPHTHYRTDFTVWMPDGRTRFYEVKGKYVREDAWLKLKTVAVLYPHFMFVLAQWDGYEWDCRDIPSE